MSTTLPTRIDDLFQDWGELGGAVLVAHGTSTPSSRTPEEVLAETTGRCRDSSRLTWVALDWLIRNVERLDEDRLFQTTAAQGDRSVLGLLCDAAREYRPHPVFDRIIHRCPRPDRLEIFFHRVAKSPLAARLAQENAVELFRRWNYVSDELTYLSPRPPQWDTGPGEALPTAPLFDSRS
jgi:hypothetical protein